MKITLSLILFLLAFMPTALLAESGERGRLADGRAFRTDSTGIQLVDHVAELELTIESLTRRLEAAENEIKHKESLLAQHVQSVAAPDLGSLAADNNCPPQPQFVCPEQDLSQLQEKLATSERINATLQDQKEKDGIWFEQTLAARDQEIAALKVQMRSRDEKPSQVTQVKGFGLSDNARAALQLANQREIKVPAESRHSNSEGPQSVDVATFKKTLKQELAKTQALLKERDELFSRFSTSGNSIQIKPSSAHSGNNRTVDQLQKDLEGEQSTRILSMMSREIADIGRQVAEDIELVKRVGKF